MPAALPSRMTSLHHADALVDGAESGPSARSSQQTSDGAPVASFVAYSLHMVKQDFNSGAIVTLTMPTSMPITVVLLMIMSYARSYPRTRTLLRPSHANVIALPRLLRTQRSFSPSQRARIKPPQQHLQMTNKSVFGREESLRLDEEIMDFQWFDTDKWGSIKDRRGI